MAASCSTGLTGFCWPRSQRHHQRVRHVAHFLHRLLSAAIEALAAPRCSPPARDAVLDTLESLLDSDDAATTAIVQRHTGAVLEALKALVLRALSPGQAGAAAKTPVVRIA